MPAIFSNMIYVENGSFGPENVAITFLLDGENLKDIVHPDFVHIGFNRGELFFKSRDHWIQKDYILNIRETYDEAKRRSFRIDV